MTSELLISQQGTLGHILLNRPKALNALSFDMLRGLTEQLEAWRDDPTIQAVCIEGTGERAFCAGGDIRAVYAHREAVLSGEVPYFECEYHLNQLIFHYPKPYIALLDGVAMGGGLGISIWGSHPIATDRLVFAMPETSIGLFPDIGASYFLTRLPDYIGYYLGLTGNTINAYEALTLNLVKTVISHQSIDSFKATLNPQNLSLPEPIPLNTSSELLTHRGTISTCFSQNTISEIIALLEQQDAWCQHVAGTLKKRSPLSLKVTFEYLKRSQGLSFNAVMKMNTCLINQFLRSHDFYEGIRAAVIDKDKQPHWQHDIKNVDEIDVSEFFKA